MSTADPPRGAVLNPASVRLWGPRTLGVLLRRGIEFAAAEDAGVPVVDFLELLPEAGETVDTITSLDDVKMLDVRLNRLRRWHTDGLLCIGDAAHAMSPAGGVGINVAVQDGVAAARLLAEPLRAGTVSERDLAAVQRRRIVPTALTQGFQRLVDRRLLGPILQGGTAPLPKFANAVERFPWLTAVPAYLVGVGVLPERAPEFARRPPT